MITPDEPNWDIQKEWERIRKEIELYINEVNLELDRKPEIRALCKGWKVWFSPLIPKPPMKPPLMFIGINPGFIYINPGDGNRDYTYKDLDHTNKKQLQYLDENWSNVRLARDTIEVFKNIGSDAFGLLAESVKTNYHYIITTTAYPPIINITDYLGRDNREDALRFYSNASKWTK